MSSTINSQPAQSTRTGGPSRRCIARCAAWSVPVIAVGAVAPEASASGCPALTQRARNAISYAALNVDRSFNPQRWTNSSTITNTLGNPSDTNKAFSVSSPTTVNYMIDSYAITLAFPYQVVWVNQSGWTITELISGTAPNRTFSYTFTALASSLTATYSSQTAANPTVGLTIPTFTGSTTNAQGKADGWINTTGTAAQRNAEKALTVPIARVGSYHVTSGAGCSTAPIPINQPGSLTITPV